MFELRYPHYANWYDLEALPHDGRKLSIKNSFFSRRGPRRCRRRCLTSPITEEKNRYPRGTCVGYLICIKLTDTKPMTIVWDTTGISHNKCNSITEIPGYYFHPQGAICLRHSVRGYQVSLWPARQWRRYVRGEEGARAVCTAAWCQ